MKKTLLILLAALAALTLVISCKNEVKIPTYTVTFDSDGGSEVPVQTVNAGEKATKPADPTRDGYDFTGWKKDGADFSFDTPINGNITLKAEWKQREYFTVTFDYNDGVTSSVTKTVRSGDKITDKPEDPTRDEYDFKGWKNNGADFSFDTPISSDLTLKAEWEKNTFTVTFDSRGGSEVSPKTVKVKKGGKVTKPADPARDGVDFGGWTLNDAAFDFDDYTVSDDITLVAKWTKDGKTIRTVTFDYNDDGKTTATTEIVADGTKITTEKPADPTRDGYDFAGWTKDNSFFNFDTSITDDITLKAAWKKIYKAGDKGPTGGYIVYDIDADNSSSEPKGSDGLASSDLGWRYIEAAPKDLENDSKNTYIFGYYKEDKIGWT